MKQHILHPLPPHEWQTTLRLFCHVVAQGATRPMVLPCNMPPRSNRAQQAMHLHPLVEVRRVPAVLEAERVGAAQMGANLNP